MLKANSAIIVFFILIIVVNIFFIKTVSGQFSIARNNNPLQLTQKLTGNGVYISNINFACDSLAAGIFSGGLPTVTGMNTGVVLATGDVTNIVQPAGGFMSDILFTPSDPDLDALVTANTNHDACVLEFDIRPLGDSIEFNFVFASEEYPEYVCSSFNDVFAFFLSGNRPGGGTYNKTNIALIPGTTLPVAINTVNPGVPGSAAGGGRCNRPNESRNYSSLYRTNNASNLVFDGMTVALKAKAAVIPCQTYRLKFAIQDVGDPIYDSGVFLTSIRSNSVSVSTYTNSPIQQNVRDIFEDSICNRAWFRFSVDTVYPVPRIAKFDILGSATNGIDYVAINVDSIIIPAGQPFIDLPVIPLKDALPEGVERIGLYLKGSCSSDYLDSAFIYIYDELRADAGPDTIVCPDQTVRLNGKATTNFPWQQLFSFRWFPSQQVSDSSIANPFVVKAPQQDTVVLFLKTQVSTCAADTDTVVIAYTRRPQFSLEAGSDKTICLGDSTVIPLNVTDSAAVAPFTFSWSPASSLNDSSIQTPTARPATNTQYTVKVANRFGCMVRDTINIFITTPPQFNLTRSLDTVCPNFPVQLSFHLQSGNYDSIVWMPHSGSNGVSNKYATTTSSSPLSTQLYSLIAYNKTCVRKDSIQVVVDDALVIDAGSDTVICLGKNVQLNVSVTRNRGATNYSWQPSSSLNSSNIPNPIASPQNNTLYKVTVTSQGCVKSDSILVQLYSISASLGKNDVSCYGGNNGSLTATSFGGFAPYSYVWSVPRPDTNSIHQLSAGYYSVTISDRNACSTQSSSVIYQPDSIAFSNVVLDNISCFNGSDGSIGVTVIGGTQSYVYNWSVAGNTSSVSNLPAGTYSLRVIDGNGCFKDSSFTLTEPPELLVDTSYQNVSCYGGSNGRAFITVSGGTPGYSITWSNGAVEDSIVNLSAGTYSVTVSDRNLCSKMSVFSLSEPQPFSVVATELKPVACFGGNDGMALAKTINGSAPFTFLWNNNRQTDTATGLSAANYSVTVTDAASCTATAGVTITQPAPLNITLVKKDVRCFNENNGEVQSLISGGVSPYTFAWSNGQTTGIASNLRAGNYSVIVTDKNGCTITGSASIYQPDSLELNLTAMDESCFGSSDGKIFVFSNGGTPNYSLSYASNGGVFQLLTGDTIYNLVPDLYTVEVKDINGCIASKSIRVHPPVADRFDYIAEKTSCFGPQYQDGNVAIIALATENAPYYFTLLGSSAGNTTGFFKNLRAGFYYVNITNKNGCDTVITVNVPEPENAVLEVFPKDTVVETGQPISLQVNLIPYTNQAIKHYMWSPQQGLSCVDCSSPVFISYDDKTEIDITVIYNNGCQASAKAIVETELNPSLYAPNMFSPNSDGINDKFFIYANKVRDFKLNIFNRWGEKVFDSESLTEGWDGYYKDILQEPGVYVYVVEISFLNNKKITKSGSVTLVR